MRAGLFGANAAMSQAASQIDPELLRRLIMVEQAKGPGAAPVTPDAASGGPTAGSPAPAGPAIDQREIRGTQFIRDAPVGPMATDPALNSTISTGPVGIQGSSTPALTRTRPGLFGAASRSPSAMAAKFVLDDTMQQNAADPSMQPLGGGGPAGGPVSGIPLNMAPNPNIADAQVQGRIHPKFFEHGGTGRKIASVAGDALLGISASLGNPLAMMHFQNQQADRAAQRRYALWSQQHQTERSDTLDDRRYEDSKPRYFSGGQDQVQFNPATGEAKTVYDAPRPEESYASQFGTKGSPGYQSALQEYILKGWSPTAMDARTDLADHRFQNSLALRGSPTYANLHPQAPTPRAPSVPRLPTTGTVQAGILQKVASGTPLTPGEQEIYGTWKSGRYRGARGVSGGAAPGAVTEGTIIKNPNTGQRMKMQGGQWVPVQ